ncbi:phosphatase PAP2 family protein [Streptomyces sp. NBC_01530]|uniref:phosphatase PAP2 family protein n=1 Tax=Streptomyces sp. NBC_01530 TaxID=2903895 RepID=UPI003863C7D3
MITAFDGPSIAGSASVREDRPCRSPRVQPPEAWPAPGDWSFPGNLAAIAATAAAAVVLLSVLRRLGLIAVGAAVAMVVSRLWVGAHDPHDVVAGAMTGALVALGWMVGGLVALASVPGLRWRSPTVVCGPSDRPSRLRPLLMAP